jgi:hypothetical protein
MYIPQNKNIIADIGIHTQEKKMLAGGGIHIQEPICQLIEEFIP